MVSGIHGRLWNQSPVDVGFLLYKILLFSNIQWRELIAEGEISLAIVASRHGEEICIISQERKEEKKMEKEEGGCHQACMAA